MSSFVIFTAGLTEISREAISVVMDSDSETLQKKIQKPNNVFASFCMWQQTNV